jgi:transposase
MLNRRWPHWGYVLAEHVVHADGPPVKVLARGEGKTRTGRLSVYLRDDGAARAQQREASAPSAHTPTSR